MEGAGIMTRKLPIGIQSFEDLRNNHYLYVDKTKYIHDLTESGKVYFLSRPRRFGKSLFLSTLEAYFLGKKELFEGLYIAQQEDAKGKNAWQKHPVILFSLSGGNYNAADGLSQSLTRVLLKHEKEYGIHSEGTDLPNRFANLIEQAYQVTGKQVVILADEYDKPLLETMEVDETQEERNRQLYKGFFSVLKDEDQYLKFVFFTGVTKFSKVSVFSDLNQLNDISLDRRYAGICGITEEELLEGFQPEIERIAGTQEQTRQECIQELAAMYDGYHFAADVSGVYNPFSILNAFDKQDYGRYWFSTGTPTFLIHELENSDFNPQQLVDGVEAAETELTDYRTDNPNPIPLFYQAGYLTICGYDREFRIYSLRFPNREVEYGFLNSLVPSVLGDANAEHPVSARNMILDLRAGRM